MMGKINALLRYSGADDEDFNATGVFSNTSRGGGKSWDSVEWSGDKVDVTFKGIPSGSNSNSGSHTHTISGTTNNTGSKAEYWQPYMTCYCWFRTA